jgi:hypothetical protein
VKRYLFAVSKRTRAEHEPPVSKRSWCGEVPLCFLSGRFFFLPFRLRSWLRLQWQYFINPKLPPQADQIAHCR